MSLPGPRKNVTRFIHLCVHSMITMLTSSLIIATYNWPAALDLCLHSVLQQSVLPAEVIIADDGSKEETRSLIENFSARFPVPLHHVWHADEGFQLARIRNRAMAQATGDYILQIDGDLLLHHHFVKDHLSFARPGSFVSGSRVLMNDALSQSLLGKRKQNVSVFTKGTKNFFNGVRLPIAGRLLSLNRPAGNDYTVRGCNMAFWKKDIIRVNGYDESFTGWGSEDWELAARLMNAGLRKRKFKMGGIVYHLYHKEVNRTMEDTNQLRLQETTRQRLTWCEKGINQYLQ